VRESRRPGFQLPLFADKEDDLLDTPVTRAARAIERLLRNPEAKTIHIEDPKLYYNFELYISDDEGNVRSSLSHRVAVGSGGEGQLPFYIAIGASLAATYQDRRTGKMGIALAIFDEAFSRLDTAAAGACAEFLKDLGLQIILAAPDEKRHVFMEFVDTVVNVNRPEHELVVVETEYLTEKTRAAISEADPYRKGFSAWKAELVAAAAALNGGAEEKAAAE
jgi:uncharacterized protein YPO0396